MTDERSRLEREFSGGVAPLYQLWRTAANDAISAEAGLSHTLAWPLVVLRQAARPVKQNELAARLALEKSTVARLVEQLVRDGYVSRQQDLDDRRAKIVALTQKGQVWAEKLEPLVARFRSSSMASIDDEELKVCISVFTRLRAVLDVPELEH